jgi:TonB family protein
VRGWYSERVPKTHPRVFFGLLAALCGLPGCRVDHPEQVVAGHHELCCKAANADNLGFVGCRASRSCRTSERVWVRGPVTCAPADPQRCSGGRCCQLDLEAIATLELDPSAMVEGPELAREPALEPVREPAPNPALIVPVPLDWQAHPTPITIPKLVCPASVERGVVGSVVLQIEVDASGHVSAAEIRSGFDPECNALARDALLHAQFEPARTPAGQSIASSLAWVYEFTLDGGEADGGHADE